MQVVSTLVVGIIASAGATSYAKIAGYEPGTDVTAHNAIDLDQADIETAVSTNDYAAATTAYAVGGNSMKSSGARTIKGFSKSLEGEPEFDKFVAYYGDNTYADMWVSGALAGTAVDYTTNGDTDFSALASTDEDTRPQAIKKGTVYLNIWMYAIHELESAMAKCDPASTDSNEAAVHAWDEGVAFYTGSLEGTDGEGSGKLMYALADKRCQNFNTCDGTTSGTSDVNKKVFLDFKLGKEKLEDGNCAGLRGVTDRIIAQGYVPIIQGALKYAYSMGDNFESGSGNTDGERKAAAEGATFAAGVIGRINACSSTAAATIWDNTKIGTSATDFTAVKTAFESTYDCMDITCADVGGYVDSGSGSDATYKFEPCATVYKSIAGYAPGTSVVAHNKIDLDQKLMEEKLALDTPDYVAAMSVYSTGGYSVKSSGSARTIQGFSKDLTDEPEFDKFVAYYGDLKYADKWVYAALNGEVADFTTNGDTDFSGVDDDTRIQAIKKGTVYLNVWMYAIHELEAAIDKCDTASTDSNEAAVHAWDEGVAFYTGSLEGTDGSGSGKLMYALADKRCSNFKTCVGGTTSGTAASTTAMFADFALGKTALEAGQCDDMRTIVDSITAQGFVPIIQGSLKYGWSMGQGGASTKAIAEAATFTAGVIGRVNHCSAEDAAIIWENTKIGQTTTDFAALKAAFERNYECMGITCADVGGYVDDDGNYREGAEACTGTGGSSGLGTGPLVGIIVGGIVGVVVITFLLKKFLCKPKKGKTAAAGAQAAQQSSSAAA